MSFSGSSLFRSMRRVPKTFWEILERWRARFRQSRNIASCSVSCGNSRKQRILATKGNLAKHPLHGTQPVEEPLREIEEVVCTEGFKAGSLEQHAGPSCGKKFRIDVHWTSLNNRSGDRIPWIVFDDTTQSTWRQHPPDLTGQQCSPAPMNMVIDAYSCHNINIATAKCQLNVLCLFIHPHCP